MGVKEDAVALKDEGNKAIAQKDWKKAVEFYTRAIELDGTQAIFYSNRAQAHIKMEAFGLAIMDATKAIELNPAYVKAYYRRAISNMGRLYLKEALRDFRTVAQKVPNDKDASQKLAECEKLVRRINFEKAIEVGEPPSAAEGLDLEKIVVDASYDGVKLGEEMTLEFINNMIERFKNGKKIHRRYAYWIIIKAKEIFYAEPTMPEVSVAEGTKLTVCGDTHGQYFDLLALFGKNGFPSPTHAYLFNGDFVDRGSWSTEIALLLFAYKILYPKTFFVNRGNHETDDMNRVYGFEGECKAKYNERTFKLFSEAFSALPLATLIGGKYLVLHGGLFSNDEITLDDIRKFDRHKMKQPRNEGLMMEMLWTDPQAEPGRAPSKRGIGMMFGPDVTERFCKKNGLDAIIRSHEVRMSGYAVEHGGRCITVFSAPNYVDSSGNLGAYINIGPDYKLQHNIFKEVEHPNIKPMAYASSSLMSLM